MTTHLQKQSLEKWMKWERRGIPSSHWTIALSDQWYIVCLLALMVAHLCLSAILPPLEDELYYWSWSQNLQSSYYDHPPMVAYLIRISTFIFGNNIFGIRFFATFATFVVFLILGTLTPGKNLLGLLLLTPLSLFGAVLMTPDVPLLLFWTLYLWWLCTASRSFAQWGDDPVSRVYRSTPIRHEQWAFGGILLGLGLFSKYSMVLAIPSTMLFLSSKYRVRSWITGFMLHLGVAFIFFLPVIYFNYQHDFAPFKFQFNHTLASGSGVFWEFLTSQALLLGALPIIMFGWVLIRMKDLCSDAVLQVCFYAFVFPFGFSLFQASKSHVEANWALFSYISFWPLAQHLLNQNSFRLLGRAVLTLSFLPPIAISVLGVIHLIHPLNFLPPHKDRLGKSQALYENAKLLVEDLKANGRTETLYLPTYQLTSYFRYLGVASEQVYPLGRASNFTLKPTTPCEAKSALFLADDLNNNPTYFSCFRQRELLKSYPIHLRNTALTTLYLIEYTR